MPYPFADTPHGCLPAGTETAHGTIVRATITAYEMADGSFVPFAVVHGPYPPVEPLVVLR
jgi:hypothetical protein